MKIKLTKQQSIIIITITTLLLIIGLYFIFKTPKKPISTKTFNYDKTQTYDQNLERWKSECLFKPGIYTSEYIRNKLGRYNQNIYLLDDKRMECVKNLDDQRTGIDGILHTIGTKLHYRYITGFIDDAWYFTVLSYTQPNYLVSNNTGRTDLLCLGSTMSNTDQIKFNTYVDTTPPPQPPFQIKEYTINNREEGYKILENNGINFSRSKSSDSYSMNAADINWIYQQFDKTNNENVDFIYCCLKLSDYSYSTGKTLDYYKNQHDIISDLYIFYKSNNYRN